MEVYTNESSYLGHAGAVTLDMSAMSYTNKIKYYLKYIWSNKVVKLCLISHKTDMQKCDTNISDKNYAKLKHYFSKMKELNQIIFQIGIFTSIKGHLCLTKRHLGWGRG